VLTVINKPVGFFQPDPTNPRKDFNHNDLCLLGDRIRNKQLVPVIARKGDLTKALPLAGRQGQQTGGLSPRENRPSTGERQEKALSGARSGSRSNHFPLTPYRKASPKCLLRRLGHIHNLLLKRGFSDAVASRAVEVVLKVGLKAIASGKAAQMTKEDRAGWLWRVALNAARRAARTEPKFVALKVDPVDEHSWSGDEENEALLERNEALLKAMHREIDKLAPKQKQAIELHGLQGCSLREVARLIGVSPGTVEYRYKAGLARLASAMKAMVKPSDH
jgi:RNA polymerase sigma factor (sigma-70 family)